VIAIVGAGFGGLGMALQLVRAGIRDFTIFERGSDVGGTWRENTYPGAACDIPSHLYSFSFEPKADWTRTYSAQDEILDYLRDCAAKYGLRDHIRFGTEVRSATYDEAASLWELGLGDGSTFRARVMISACGQLNRPAIPAIAGRDSFAGTAFHSAQWRHDAELEGKRIAVIGTGASAIQFVPQLAQSAASLALLQRSAPYVIPKPDRPYARAALRLFRRFPFVQRLNRIFKYLAQESNFAAFSFAQVLIALPRRTFLRQLEAHIADPELRRKLMPDYVMGCKRILLANDYYPALARPNVEVVTESIERVTPTGIITEDGRERPFDAIVYGTGFTASEFLAPMRVTGRNGLDLQTAWKGGAHAYLGIAVAGFPNLFLLYGPNTNLGHNSIIYMLEAQIRYVLDAVEKLSERPGARLEVKAERETRFNDGLQQRLAKTVWASGCGSWYFDRSGKNTVNWPDFTFVYRARTRAVDLDDYLPLHA